MSPGKIFPTIMNNREMCFLLGYICQAASFEQF